MKNIFGVNLKGPGEPDGKEFIVRSAEGELAHRQEEVAQEVSAYQRRAGVPLWLKIIQLIAFVGGGVCIIGVVKALGNDTPWETAKQNGAVWFLVAGGIGLAVALAIFLLDKFFNRKVMGSGAYAEANGRMEKVNAEACEALAIPAEAKTCDVLLESYRTRAKDGKRAVFSASTYFNFSAIVFREGDAICFADPTTVFKIPLERIERLVLVPKRIMFSGWNKEVPFNKGEYKQYKIRRNNYGYFVKPHLMLCIRGSEEFMILLPPYEVALIEQLTGKYAE